MSCSSPSPSQGAALCPQHPFVIPSFPPLLSSSPPLAGCCSNVASVGLGCFPIPKTGQTAPLNSGPYLTQLRGKPCGVMIPVLWEEMGSIPWGPCLRREMNKCLCFHVPFHPAPLPQQPSVTEKLHLPSLQEPKPNLSSLSRRRAAPSPPTRVTCPARSPAAPPGPKMPRPAATLPRAWRAPR